MRSLFVYSLVLAGVSVCCAQAPSPVLLSASNLSPFPLSVAPGQLLTLFVQPATPISPITTSAVSATFSTLGADQPMPVVQVAQTNTACDFPLAGQCSQVLAVTVQIPFGIQIYCPVCASPIVPGAQNIVIFVNGVASQSVGVQGFADQVHFLSACDVIVAGANPSLQLNGGLPCTPMVTHADGRPVSNILPAQAGEELVAYATGLGVTNPALTAGQPAAQSSPTVTAFGIDFNFRANALATMPGAIGASTGTPLFTGATKGYIGLYQINFIVPTPPVGLQPCVDNAAVPPPGLAVKSNLTVSVGSYYSFDGAGICVRPEPVLDPPAA
ncbi:MAG: hypothetical protein ACLPWF_21990 [Bryobacteraceae bacterium]